MISTDISQNFQNIAPHSNLNLAETMYVTSPNSMYNYAFNWRNDSGELDVFEAAHYFSSAVDDQIPGNFNNASKFSQKVMGGKRQHQGQRAARMSLDSIMRDEITPQDQAKYSYESKENKKYRQPSSPGGKLASFLNSLFNETRSKKKRKSQFVGPKYLQEKEIPGERRERRNSNSHFRTNTNTKNVDSKSRNFCVSSGFMQSTPTKPGKELKFGDIFERQKHKDDGNVKQNSLQNEFFSEKKRTDDAWIEEINKNSGMNWIDDQYTSEEKEFRKFSDCDDGGDTDSSSDLFELPNCDFEFYSRERCCQHSTTMKVGYVWCNESEKLRRNTSYCRSMF